MLTRTPGQNISIFYNLWCNLSRFRDFGGYRDRIDNRLSTAPFAVTDQHQYHFVMVRQPHCPELDAESLHHELCSISADCRHTQNCYHCYN
jgi:hypothetical protein